MRSLQLEQQLQTTAVRLPLGGDVTSQTAQDLGRTPQGDEVRHREGAIQPSPPVHAEGTIIQGADIQLGTHPVTLDGLSDHLDDKADDALTIVVQVRMGLRQLGGNPLLPQGTYGGDPEHCPQAEEGIWRTRAGPLGDVIAKDEIRGAREVDA